MVKPDRATMIIALALALFLWAYVRIVHETPETARILRNVPVRTEGKLASGLAYRLLDDNRAVDLQIKGPAERVNNILRDEVVLYVNLSGITHAQTAVLQPRATLPVGVRATQLPKISLLVFPTKLQTLPVMISFIAAPPPGTTVGEYVISPATVTIDGSREALKQVKYVSIRLDPTQPLTAERDFIPQAVDAEGKEVDGVRVLTATVKVRMSSLTGQQVTRQVAVAQPELTNQPHGYVVRVVRLRPEEVTLTGDRALLDRQPAYVATEKIDVHKITKDTTVTVPLQVPRGLSVVEGTTVRVDVEAQPVE